MVDAESPRKAAINEAEYPSSHILFISDFSCMVILLLLSSISVNTLFEYSFSCVIPHDRYHNISRRDLPSPRYHNSKNFGVDDVDDKKLVSIKE